MHTIMVIIGGLVLLGLFLLAGRLAGAATRAALWFLPVWLVAAAVNMWIGVSCAGYTVAAEAPIFLIVFAVPAAAALLSRWLLARS